MSIDDYINSKENLAKETKSEEDSLMKFFSVKRFLEVLFIYKWLFLIIVSLFLVGSIVFCLYQPKYYQSDYEVFYNESVKEIVESSIKLTKTSFDKDFWLSTMKSDEVTQLTLKNSGLPYNTAIIDRMIKVEMVEKKDKQIPTYKVTLTSKKSEIIPIIIKAYVQALNDILIKTQEQNSEKLVSFLNGQINDNTNKLNVIDNEILQKGVKYIDKKFDYQKQSTDLEEFRKQLLNSQIELSSVKAAKQRSEQEIAKLDGTIINEASYSEPLKVQLMNLQVELAKALTKNREDHPAIKSIRDNITQINGMIRDSLQEKLAIKNIVQNPLKAQLMSKLMELQITEITLETKILSLSSVIGDFQSKMLPDSSDENLQKLSRSREIIFSTINLLNTKLIEAQSESQGSLCRFVIVNDVEVPTTPASKSWYFYVLLGILAGLFAGTGAVYLYDQLDNRIKLTDDYERFYSFPLLGCLPFVKNPTKIESTPQQKNYNLYNIQDTEKIVTNIKQILKFTDKKTFAIASPIRGEGKTHVSIEIAKALAKKRVKVLLIDSDFYAPRLSGNLPIQTDKGLTDYICNNCQVEEIINHSQYSNLDFIYLGDNELSSEITYENKRFSELLNEMKAIYDIVLLDTPAFLFIPDVINLFDSIEGIITVIKLNYTTRNSLNKFLADLRLNVHKNVGVIANGQKINLITKYKSKYYYKKKYNTSDDNKLISLIKKTKIAS